MRRWVWLAALAGISFYLLSNDAVVPGVLGLAAAGLIGYRAMQNSRPTPTPVPTAHAAARSEGRQIVRDAEARARSVVRQAEKSAEKRGRKALAAAQAQLDREAAERWVS